MQDLMNCLVVSEGAYKVVDMGRTAASEMVQRIRSQFPPTLATIQRVQWSLPSVYHRCVCFPEFSQPKWPVLALPPSLALHQEALAVTTASNHVSGMTSALSYFCPHTRHRILNSSAAVGICWRKMTARCTCPSWARNSAEIWSQMQLCSKRRCGRMWGQFQRQGCVLLTSRDSFLTEAFAVKQVRL